MKRTTLIVSAVCFALGAVNALAEDKMGHDAMGKPETHGKMGNEAMGKPDARDKMGRTDKRNKSDKMGDKMGKMDKMEKPGAMQ